jgi:hypothetical protein
MTNPTEDEKDSGYRFWLHEQKTERGWSDAWADLMTNLATATFRLVQWCITIGAIQALNKIAPSNWLVALQGVLWVLLVAYVGGNLTRVEIDLFREVNTRIKWWLNLTITLGVALALMLVTYKATQAVIDAASRTSTGF